MNNKQLNQKDNPEEFFEKYGFTKSATQHHPEFKDAMMHFEGLEAHYVGLLERQVKELEKYIQHQNEKIDFMMNREFYAWKAGKKDGDL